MALLVGYMMLSFRDGALWPCQPNPARSVIYDAPWHAPINMIQAQVAQMIECLAQRKSVNRPRKPHLAYGKLRLLSSFTTSRDGNRCGLQCFLQTIVASTPSESCIPYPLSLPLQATSPPHTLHSPIHSYD